MEAEAGETVQQEKEAGVEVEREPALSPSQPLPDPDTCWPDTLARGIGMTGQPDSSVGLHIPLQSITEADHRGRLENRTTG